MPRFVRRPRLAHALAIVAAMATLLLSGAAVAQDAEPGPDAPSPVTPHARTGVPRAIEVGRVGLLHALEAPLRDGGSVSITRATAEAGLGGPFAGGFGRLTLRAERSFYDFVGERGFDPVRRALPVAASDLTLGGFSSLPVNEDVRIILGPRLSLSFEDGADLDRSLVGGGFVAVRIAITETFALQPGVLSFTRLEESPLVVPIFGFEWRLDDLWRLETRGPALRLTRETNELLLAASVGWTFRQFRLDDDGPLPQGAFEDQRVPLTLEAEWRPVPRIALGASLGGVIWQRFELRDRRGDFVASDRTLPTLEVGAALGLRIVF